MQRFFLLCFLFSPAILLAQDVTGIYKRYEGRIGKAMVLTVDLHFADTMVTGYCYNNSTGDRMKLTGSLKMGKFMLEQIQRDTIKGYFIGMMPDDLSTATGKWHDGSSSGAMKFEFKQILRDGSVAIHSLNRTLGYEWKKNAEGIPLGCTAQYIYCYVVGMKNKQAEIAINNVLLHTRLTEELSKEQLKLAASTAMEEEFETFVDSYRETFADTVSEESLTFMDESPSMFTWDYQEIYNAVYNEHYLLCIEEYGYYYSGGAHGNYGYSYHVFDLNSGKLLQLADLFRPEKLAELTQATEKQLRADRGITGDGALTASGLFVDKLELKEDFFVDHGGIGFLYNPYEIASYADGAITVYLKWDQVKNYINPVGPLSWVVIR